MSERTFRRPLEWGLSPAVATAPRSVRIILCFALGGLTGTATGIAKAQTQDSVSRPPLETPSLARVIQLAVDNAPDVLIGRSALRSSESAYVGARLFPIQNPYIELFASNTRRSGDQNTLLLGTAWLPLEISGQRGARIGEAKAFVAIHQMELERARAQARGIAVRA